MSAADSTDMQSQREQAYKSYQQGNYKDAYDVYRKLALDPKDDPRLVGSDLNMATSCLQSLNRADEIDDFREAVVEVHKNNWRLLQATAANYLNDPHFGFIVAGKFYRGNKRGGGNFVNANDRDRVRALQLMLQAMPLAEKDDNHAEVGAFFLSLGDMLLANRRGLEEAWRLQYLTDLKTLPDYEPGWGNYRETHGTRSMLTVSRSFMLFPRVSRQPSPTVSVGGGACNSPRNSILIFSTIPANNSPISSTSSSACKPWLITAGISGGCKATIPNLMKAALSP